MKKYRIVAKGDRDIARYFAQRRFLLIFWIPISFCSIWDGGELCYDDAVNIIENHKSRYKKKYYLED